MRHRLLPDIDSQMLQSRTAGCLLKLLLFASVYVLLVVCFLSVYNGKEIDVTPYLGAEQQSSYCIPPSCNDSLTGNENNVTVPTSWVSSLPLVYNETAGYLNYDVWRQMPGYVVDDMRVRRSFPNHPDIRKITDTLKINFSEEAGDSHHDGKYAHKIYGFLKPLATGTHTFGFDISKRTALYGLELWLSNSTNPLHTRRILTAEVAKQSANEFITSEAIWLDSRLLYYMEFLEKAFDGSIIVELKWKVPDASNFMSISNDSFVPAVQLNNTAKSPMATILQGPLPSNKLQSHWRVVFVGDTVYPATDLDVLPPCNFTCLRASPHNSREYEAYNEAMVFSSGVYPGYHMIDWTTTHNKVPAYMIKKEVVDNVLGLYKAALNRSTKYKGTVEQLHYMEQTVNSKHGERYLVELDVLLDGQNTTIHTSEYVYLAQGSTQLCHTVNFEWKHNAFVYLVVPLKNLGLWTKHLIHNIEHIQRVTKDFNVELVIVDYESSDLNVEEELSKSSLPKWHYIRKSGLFSRARGLQAGIDYITDPNSIVLTLDMHLVIPPGFINYVRKHIVQGKMAFSPIFFRLNKGHTEVNPQGFWEPYTFGIFGMYKSDWIKVGGFDIVKFSYEWGREDVDLADRTLAKGYEIFRIRYPGFLHYYHSRKGLWSTKR